MDLWFPISSGGLCLIIIIIYPDAQIIPDLVHGSPFKPTSMSLTCPHRSLSTHFLTFWHKHIF